MSDDSDKKQLELKHVQDALKKGVVSRRSFLDSMKGIGVGFGAAFLLGMKEADAALDSAVNVASTNPAIDNIVKEGQAQQAIGDPNDADPKLQMAQYLRMYRRGYRRGYRRYGRFYRRGYRRFYRRYARVYPRVYMRF